jgi:hypothetical protein
MAYFYDNDQPTAPGQFIIDVGQGDEYRPLGSLLSTGSDIRTTDLALSQYLRITAYVIDFKLDDVNWSTSDRNNMSRHAVDESLKDGLHIVIPWFGGYRICVRPNWDDADLDVSERSTLTCMTFLSDADVARSKPSFHVFYVLDRRGDHYERVGIFRLCLAYRIAIPPGIGAVFRDTEGKVCHTDAGCCKRKQGRLPWLEGAEKRTLLLG